MKKAHMTCAFFILATPAWATHLDYLSQWECHLTDVKRAIALLGPDRALLFCWTNWTIKTKSGKILFLNQIGEADEWEKYQLVTQLAFSGSEGMEAIRELARLQAADPETRAVALQAVVQAEMPGWQDLINQTGDSPPKPLKETKEWACSRFLSTEPEAIQGCPSR